MKPIAVISAAGWKGSGREHGLPEVPEPFLPLGDGTCTLSRCAIELRDLGFDIYIAIAPLGYPFGEYWPKFQLEELDPYDSPWTLERYDYVASLGMPVEVEDPGHHGSHDTFCKAIEQLPHWERLFLARGDILLPRGHLKRVSEIKCPSQYVLCPNHSYFMFNQEAAHFYLEYMEKFRKTRWETRAEWWGKRRHRYLPDGHWQGVQIFREAGILAYSEKVKWTDVDTPDTYRDALEMVEEELNVEQ